MALDYYEDERDKPSGRCACCGAPQSEMVSIISEWTVVIYRDTNWLVRCAWQSDWNDSVVYDAPGSLFETTELVKAAFDRVNLDV